MDIMDTLRLKPFQQLKKWFQGTFSSEKPGRRHKQDNHCGITTESLILDTERAGTVETAVVERLEPCIQPPLPSPQPPALPLPQDLNQMSPESLVKKYYGSVCKKLCASLRPRALPRRKRTFIRNKISPLIVPPCANEEDIYRNQRCPESLFYIQTPSPTPLPSPSQMSPESLVKKYYGSVCKKLCASLRPGALPRRKRTFIRNKISPLIVPPCANEEDIYRNQRCPESLFYRQTPPPSPLPSPSQMSPESLEKKDCGSVCKKLCASLRTGALPRRKITFIRNKISPLIVPPCANEEDIYRNQRCPERLFYIQTPSPTPPPSPLPSPPPSPSPPVTPGRSPEILDEMNEDTFWHNVYVGANMAALACEAERDRSPTVSIRSASSMSSLSSVDSEMPDELRAIPHLSFGPSPSPSPSLPLVPKKIAVMAPRRIPVAAPKRIPVVAPSRIPVAAPKRIPVVAPSRIPVAAPKRIPVVAPRRIPVAAPKRIPVVAPSRIPVAAPKRIPVVEPKRIPAAAPKRSPAEEPKRIPAAAPKRSPAEEPKKTPQAAPKRQKVELQPLVRPVDNLCACLQQLSSDDWTKKISALTTVQALAQHHPETLKTRLHDVCLALIQEVDNLRSAVSCAAMATLAELYENLKKAMDQEVERTGRVLLLKFAQRTSDFIHREANYALDAMVESCSHGRVLTVLWNTALSHRCAAVRGSMAQHLHQLADGLGAGRILTAGGSFTEHFLDAVSKICMDAAPDVRQHGRGILQDLALHKDFQKLWKKFVPEKDRTSLNKVLKR